jgi:hypothetical protein
MSKPQTILEAAQSILEGSDLQEGYIEAMGDDFSDACDEIGKAWKRWKNGPETKSSDISRARNDVVSFIIRKLV